MAIRCQPCQAVLGAEVDGVDLPQRERNILKQVVTEIVNTYGAQRTHERGR